MKLSQIHADHWSVITKVPSWPLLAPSSFIVGNVVVLFLWLIDKITLPAAGIIIYFIIQGLLEISRNIVLKNIDTNNKAVVMVSEIYEKDNAKIELL